MAKRISLDALLLAIALIIFVLEAQIPPLIPIPGVKLGLANIVTVYALFRTGARDAFAILICRILLGCVFSGQIMALLFSLGGGLFCFGAMLLLKRYLSEKQLWICSVIGAVFHNLGQMTVALLFFQTTAILAYLPVLIISGIVTGAFTGICAQLLINRLGRTRAR